MKLLSVGTNQKTSKSDGLGEYLTAIMYLAPHTEAGGKSLCSFSTEGCRESCLYTAGRGNMPSVVSARINRTKLYLDDPMGFYGQLVRELLSFRKKCEREGKKPAVRLNGTSDILWERFDPFGLDQSFIEVSKDIQFYDYTKVLTRMTTDLPDNYHLTFSRGEDTSDNLVKGLCGATRNVSVVFDTPMSQELPEEYLGIPVIDGRTHDLRFLDESGVIVGLSALGKARKDTSGFVVNV